MKERKFKLLRLENVKSVLVIFTAHERITENATGLFSVENLTLQCIAR